MKGISNAVAGTSLEHLVINIRDFASVAELVVQNVNQKMSISKAIRTKYKVAVIMEQRKEMREKEKKKEEKREMREEEKKEELKKERKGELQTIKKKLGQKLLCMLPEICMEFSKE